MCLAEEGGGLCFGVNRCLFAYNFLDKPDQHLLGQEPMLASRNVQTSRTNSKDPAALNQDDELA